jgi:hypothetical protein
MNPTSKHSGENGAAVSDRNALIQKMKAGHKLTKEESDALGPLTNRDLAPISGDAFIDDVIQKTGYNDYSAMLIAYSLGKDCTAYALALKLRDEGKLDDARMTDVLHVIKRLKPTEPEGGMNRDTRTDSR